MSTRVVVVISERALFRKTFCRALSALDSTLDLLEIHSIAQQSIKLPAAGQGLVLMDAGGLSEQGVIERVLACLVIEPLSQVAMVIDEPDDGLVDAAMTAGALGVLIKASTPLHLSEMLRRLLNGERCRPAPVSALVPEDLPEHLRVQLSARQQKMLRLIIGGQSISATARILQITPAKLVHEMRQTLKLVKGR